MKTTKTSIALLAALALPLAGCSDLFYAETELAEACLTPPQESFPGGLASGNLDFSYDLGDQIDLLTQDDVTYELRLTGFDALLQGTGAADLSTVERIRFLATAPGLPDRLVFDYVPPAGNPDPTRLVVRATPNIELGEYLRAGAIGLRLQVVAPTGQTLDQFTADFGACFYVKARYDYL